MNTTTTTDVFNEPVQPNKTMILDSETSDVIVYTYDPLTESELTLLHEDAKQASTTSNNDNDPIGLVISPKLVLDDATCKAARMVGILQSLHPKMTFAVVAIPATHGDNATFIAVKAFNRTNVEFTDSEEPRGFVISGMYAPLQPVTGSAAALSGLQARAQANAVESGKSV